MNPTSRFYEDLSYLTLVEHSRLQTQLNHIQNNHQYHWDGVLLQQTTHPARSRLFLYPTVALQESQLDLLNMLSISYPNWVWPVFMARE